MLCLVALHAACVGCALVASPCSVGCSRPALAPSLVAVLRSHGFDSRFGVERCSTSALQQALAVHSVCRDAQVPSARLLLHYCCCMRAPEAPPLAVIWLGRIPVLPAIALSSFRPVLLGLHRVQMLLLYSLPTVSCTARCAPVSAALRGTISQFAQCNTKVFKLFCVRNAWQTKPLRGAM